MGVVYNPDRNTLIPISTVSGEIVNLSAGLIYEKMQTCLIIGTEVTYLKHYPDQDIYLADYSYIQGGTNGAIFSNRAQRDVFSYFHRWNPNTQEFVIRGGVSLNLSNITKNGIMYYYFPNTNAYTILAYDYNKLYFNNVEEVKATVRVNYALPSDQNYTYAKIVYKKDTRPDNEEDGTAITILKDESFVNISKLDVGSNYWFTIFTDKNQSESFPYTIEELPYPPEYQTYIDKMNKPLNVDDVSSFNDGFWFANFENQYRDSDGTSFYTIYPFTSVSWFWAVSGHMITPGSFITLDISGDDTNGYGCSVSFNLQTWVKMNMGDTVYYTNEYRTIVNYKQYHVFKGDGYSGSLNFSEQYSNTTLIGLFERLSQNYRNVNIKVNGIYWSKVK